LWSERRQRDTIRGVQIQIIVYAYMYIHGRAWSIIVVWALEYGN